MVGPERTGGEERGAPNSGAAYVTLASYPGPWWEPGYEANVTRAKLTA